MSNFMDKLMSVFNKISTQKHLVTIRDAFGLITPIIIAGAISLIGGIFIFGGSGGASTSLLGWIANAAGGITKSGAKWSFVPDSSWASASLIGSSLFSQVTNGTIGIIALLIAFQVAFVYARSYAKTVDPVMAGLVGLASFGVVSHGFSGGNVMFIGSNGMLIALFISFVSVIILSKLWSLEKLKVKMPEGVPPAVAKGFSYLFPILLTLLAVSAINAMALMIAHLSELDIMSSSQSINGRTETTVRLAHGTYGFSGLFYYVITAPFQGFANSASGGLGIGIFYSLFVGVFWYFGINGSSVMNGVFYPILLGQVLSNTDLVSEMGYADAHASGLMSIMSITFLENYAQLTGWGMTGGLIIATFLVGKHKEKKEIAKLSAVPALFNVNEPMTFGYPIMLNPVYAIPTLVTMPLATLLAYLAVLFGWVRVSYIQVPWTVPAGVGAFLATGFDWRAIILAWSMVGVSVAIFLPFVIIENKMLSRDKGEENSSTEETPTKAKAVK